ncbi:MAG: DUF1893 domain-containing protein [Clostridia bacterium]|nr:DUF1893 domain-containing protein [Clostridia bacterium]
MNTAYSKKITLAGFFLALGIILPLVTAHGFGMSGNILLPMHIPVLLCGFFCGHVMGFLCGLLLPILNSILTGMPSLFPMALIMTCELSVYGLTSGLFYRMSRCNQSYASLYIVLLSSMILGRVAYGIACCILLLSGTQLGSISVVGAVATGLPGIVIQLILIPTLVRRIRPTFPACDAAQIAITRIQNGTASCVVVKHNRIISSDSPRGIAHVIALHESGKLKNAFVADKIVGKAAAMIFSLGGVKGCYGENVSESAVKWLKAHGIPFTYTNCSEYIVNRKGDGMCPMEETVLHMEDAEKALLALKQKTAK